MKLQLHLICGICSFVQWEREENVCFRLFELVSVRMVSLWVRWQGMGEGSYEDQPQRGWRDAVRFWWRLSGTDLHQHQPDVHRWTLHLHWRQNMWFLIKNNRKNFTYSLIIRYVMRREMRGAWHVLHTAEMIMCPIGRLRVRATTALKQCFLVISPIEPKRFGMTEISFQ